ncbi:NUDIX hydrolase [Endozoicomonas sp. SM1973]|uniref:NUDIX hydrolase n=1 Tax=Spartinivicinus marinus TaxID=2994442 RepID=A0A853HVF4_9GAMM|nr:NUDIX hydrolase [Spartinivicinus marinus]MCX4025538.1 NUDIX hydrolase [Spartinivicinus marinus]NYZ65233.1 NUDIX hydrolase [Spartinivicinus marinus]
MKYCSQCGKLVALFIPTGDNRPRYVCSHCQTIHYQNPKIVAGCLPVYKELILLCKRAIEPRKSFWTLPAGFMELGETTLQAAQRETWEEALATVEQLELYTVFNLPHISQVYMIFRAQLKEPKFGSGEESYDVQLFNETDIPWQQLAFPTIEKTLQHYFVDRQSGSFPVRVEDITQSIKKR